MPRSAVEAPQQLDWTSCSNRLADLVPCRYPVRSKKSLTKRANFSATLLQMHSHCKTCGNPLHADETHAECVSRLGKSHAVLSGAECLHCECFRLASLRSRIASFSRKRLRSSCPLVFFLPGICENKTAVREFERLVTSELMSSQCLRASPSPQRERAFAHPLHST